MPKKVLNLNNFSGGLNDNITPRDLNTNEFQTLINLDNEIPGKLTAIGECGGGFTGSDISALATLNHGSGLHTANLDHNLGSEGTYQEGEYLFINDKDDKLVRILNITSGAGVLESDTIAYELYQGGGSSMSASQVHMYTIDGSTKIIPQYGNNGTPKSFEFFNYSRDLGHSGATTANKSILSNDYKTVDLHIAPLHSDTLGYNYNIEDRYKRGTKFNPDEHSEVYSPTAIVVTADTQTITIPSPTQLEAQLEDWENGNINGYTIRGEGSMCFMAAFSNQATADTPSSISVQADRRYGFFASKVYKGNDSAKKVESPAVFIGVAEQDGGMSTPVNQYMRFGLIGRMGKKEERYAGIKIYWAIISDWEIVGLKEEGSIGPKFLLTEVDFEKGVRLAGSESWEPFGEQAPNTDTHFTYPTNYVVGSTFVGKQLSVLSYLEPYTGGVQSCIGLKDTGFTTSTMLNRRIYAGNVKYYDKDNNLVVKRDRVLKSKVNEFDYFPVDTFIDVAIEDGDSIVRLATLGSKLLQFKKRKLFIINCSRDIEFLEAKYDYKGAEKEYHVVEGEGFVAWFNRHGAYLYDGKRVSDIHLNKFGQSKFSNWYNKLGGSVVGAGFIDCIIGYLPGTKELIISNFKFNLLLKYDLKSESWVQGDNFENNAGSGNAITRDQTADMSNMVTTDDGTLSYLIETTAGLGNVKLRKFSKTPASFTESNKTLLKTKEFDFQNPSVNKNVTTVYLNYKSGSNLFVKGFSVSGDGIPQEDYLGASEQALTNTANSFRTQKIKVTNSDFKHITSFGLIIYANGAVASSFELNDIQIVFREKAGR